MADKAEKLKWIHRLPPLLRRHKLIQFMLRISPDLKIQMMTFNGGAKLFADLSDGFMREYFLTQTFEPEFFAIAFPFLKTGGTYFDVGANAGFCTFGILEKLGGDRLDCHLFEAQTNLCRLLERSAALYPDASIHIQQGCVADQPGQTGFREVPGNLGTSHADPAAAERAANVVLDEYIRSRGIHKVDFMKMDIEGYEDRALKGARSSLVSGVIQVLYLEASQPNSRRYGTTVDASLNLLKECGFGLYYVKSIDFKNGTANADDAFLIDINGTEMRLSPLTHFPEDYQTDILAIHSSSPWLRSRGGAKR